MTTILRIESSSNPSGLTRQVGTTLIESLTRANSGANVVTRDLVSQPLPHISPEFVSVLYNGDNTLPPLALSETLIAELQSADILIIEAPMYNFGIPSALKAWIDHVVRKGRTFDYSATGPVGLANAKKAYIVTSSGGVYTDGPYKVYEHAESHLRGVLGFIGIPDIETIRTEGLSMGPEKAAEALAHATQQASKAAA